MSDKHHNVTDDNDGEVDHTLHLSKDVGLLYLNNDYSDVNLKVDDGDIPGHKVILAARSDYFRALLFGGMKESHEAEVILKVNSVDAFKLLLKYIYTGRISLRSLKEEMVLDILGLANQYGFTQLEKSISDYLEALLKQENQKIKNIWGISNVCQIYDSASLYGLESLTSVCCTFIDRNALDIIHHESFYNLSPQALKEMISRDSFCAQEIDIFKAVAEWVKRKPQTDGLDIVSCIRLPLIGLSDLLNVVRPLELVTADAILDAIKSRNESRDTELKYRGVLLPEDNVASPRHGAQVLLGEMKSALLDGDVHTYDMEKGFTRHHIDDNGQGILIKFGMPCIVNYMKILLWDKDTRAYSYFIEVSMDQNDWIRVVDHSMYLCRSWQHLYFPQRVVRFIRIVGTHNTVNRVFHIVSLECYYVSKPFLVHKGLLVPRHNVATVSNGACVIEGVSRSRNALINGDFASYDWDTGYTCHQLGSGAIVVQLNQPYMIDSMRLLLWDIDARTYSYYIEVSTDQQNWHIVVDKKGESCRSWQSIKFPMRPVVFVRIVGTYNTANEVFHCVHFECPSQTAEDEVKDELADSVDKMTEELNKELNAELFAGESQK